MFLHRGDNRLRGFDGRGQRVGRVHDEDRIVGGVAQHALAGLRVALTIGIAENVDRIGTGPPLRQRLVETFLDVFRKPCEFAAEIDQPIHREHAETAAIGDNGQPVPVR